MYRKTYAKINHNILKENVQEIRTKYPDYKYYIGVLKNNAYHHGVKIVNALKEGGINYLAVSSLEEALEIRKYNVELPILILEPIFSDYIYDCIHNNIAITIDSLEELEIIAKMNLSYELKIHLKIDSGMNRLGFKDQKEFESAVDFIKKTTNLVLEGIYTHFATSGVNDAHWDQQRKNFRFITENIDLKSIPIVHLGRSLTLVQHEKMKECNAIRLGIILFGFSQSQQKDFSWKGKLRALKNNHFKKKNHVSETYLENELHLKTAFSLYTNVLSVRKVKEGEFVGYHADYKIKEDGYIATLPIGYADGVTKKFGFVFINQKKYPIVSDTMDMVMILVDNTIQKGMKVEIFGDHIPISSVTSRLGINAYHLFNQISNRVPRIDVMGDYEEETKY